MQTAKSVETADYNESSEEAKHPGAILGLIMGIYKAILVVGIILIFSCIGIRNAYQAIFPDSRPVQREPAIPAEILHNAPNPENVSSK